MMQLRYIDFLSVGVPKEVSSVLPYEIQLQLGSDTVYDHYTP